MNICWIWTYKSFIFNLDYEIDVFVAIFYIKSSKYMYENN